MDVLLTGMYGEAIALTRLLSWGYPATLVPGPLTYDLVVDVAGLPYRIQVKATNRECKHGDGENSFSFLISCAGKKKRRCYNLGEYDILACVSLYNNNILFLPFTDKIRIRRKVSTFTKEKELASWEACLKYLSSTEKKN